MKVVARAAGEDLAGHGQEVLGAVHQDGIVDPGQVDGVVALEPGPATDQVHARCAHEAWTAAECLGPSGVDGIAQAVSVTPQSGPAGSRPLRCPPRAGGRGQEAATSTRFS